MCSCSTRSARAARASSARPRSPCSCTACSYSGPNRSLSSSLLRRWLNSQKATTAATMTITRSSTTLVCIVGILLSDSVLEGRRRCATCRAPGWPAGRGLPWPLCQLTEVAVRLALFDDYRLGVVTGEEIRDVTGALPAHDPTWPWAFVPRTIAEFDRLRPAIEQAAAAAEPRPLREVRLLPPVPQPGKIVAAAANYHMHHQEMG